MREGREGEGGGTVIYLYEFCLFIASDFFNLTLEKYMIFFFFFILPCDCNQGPVGANLENRGTPIGANI